MLLSFKKLLQEPLSETQRMGGARVGKQEPSEEVISRSQPHTLGWGGPTLPPPTHIAPQQAPPLLEYARERYAPTLKPSPPTYKMQSRVLVLDSGPVQQAPASPLALHPSGSHHSIHTSFPPLLKHLAQSSLNCLCPVFSCWTMPP